MTLPHSQWNLASRLFERGYSTSAVEGHPYARQLFDFVTGRWLGIVEPIAALHWLEGEPASDVEGQELPALRGEL